MSKRIGKGIFPADTDFRVRSLNTTGSGSREVNIRKTAFLLAALFFIFTLPGCNTKSTDSPSESFSETSSESNDSIAETLDRDVEDQDVKRGLSGKKGNTKESGDSKLKLSDREITVYDGHLDTVVLIYMVGSNLESENNLGTMDLQEIGDAIEATGKSDSSVKILVETGGSRKWGSDFTIDADKIQRFEVGAHELTLKDETELANMSKPETLADFLNWGVNAYPADHYDLILWNHGGGSVMGFGADEQYSGFMMRLQQMKKAFEAVNCHFDFIGFDACLMGTVETAYTLAPFADYLIASEEMEPGDGWYYTNWVQKLLLDPNLAPEKIGMQIVDDFADSNEESGDIYTLSLIDLKKIGEVYRKLIDFAESADRTITNRAYDTIAKARSDSRSFGDGNYEQVDIIDFAEKSSIPEGNELKNTVSDAVIYFKSNMKNANGLAMYFPDRSLEKYDQMLGLFDALKFDSPYTDSLSGFCTIMAQTAGETTDGHEYAEKEWYRQDMAKLYESLTDLGLPEMIPYREMDGANVIDMTPEQLDKMTYCGQEVWLDTGKDFMEMGVDIWSENKNGSYIVASYHNVWMTLNNVFVPYYMQDLGMRTDGTAYAFGYVPAILNDDDYIWIRVELLQPEKSEGSARVCGYWIVEEMDTEGGDVTRNLKSLKEGDTLSFVATIHSYDGNETSFGQMGDTITVPKENLTVGYCRMEGANTAIRFLLEDVYKNTYYTDWFYND
ncbi:clostripain-related cysteine peptidase [Oribacterium sp. WCC10]|uniref:clostripain-related cysteine peptidase n=1 Tax=Oribacterium sp. WCC10 TaxID=1855343 RepID=UPI0008E7A925|nr:clostripain-related cysteine peptidase [Oribacterium sp. WCC10]SFG62048.1 hypothetical protein SAMN05216356_11522 [Oribacterium sp. WCC10]